MVGSDDLSLAVWAGIAFCLSQSAMFSGLNLAFFGVTRLRLEVEAAAGDAAASRVLAQRQDSNFLLCTILWGNVAVNCLLTLLSNSVLAGVASFGFSTFVITFAGEIVPQAYFSRHALRMASMLSPVLRVYQKLLYPVVKPSALLLDWWLGPEGIQYFRERDLHHVIRRHIDAAETDVDHLEGMGALNFFALDDLTVLEEGEIVASDSVVSLPVAAGRVAFPKFEPSSSDPFLRKVQASGKKWVILTDPGGDPQLVLDADGFLRATLFGGEERSPYAFCHRPIVIRDTTVCLGDVLGRLKVQAESPSDDVIDQDIILVWGLEPRVITGADILGRLLRGIVVREPSVRRKRGAGSAR